MAKIFFAGKVIEQGKHATVLEAILSANIAYEYQCRDGFCGSCRCRLRQGEIAYIKPTLAFVQPDEMLPCCAVALTDIYVDAKPLP